MHGVSREEPDDGVSAAAAIAVQSLPDLARLLRQLRRRQAREHGRTELTYREIAEQTGISVPRVGAYLTGSALPPTNRFDELVLALGATTAELRPLATARDRVADTGHRPGHHVVIPRTLPAPVRDFTGRSDPIAWLDGLLDAANDAPAEVPVVISAVAGMAGVGKTSLAVHWAHRVHHRFPDGQLYINLRGYDPEAPLDTRTALAVLLAGMGIAPDAFPPDEAGSAALYRSVLAGRRVLVLLDNARSAEQVRPLLPPPPGLALVTSRDSLAGLVAADGAVRLTLNALSDDEAVRLLARLIGDRADRDPTTVLALAHRCANLPLALRVAAELATAHPAQPLAALVADLTANLTAFEIDDERADLRSTFSWSLRAVPEPAGTVFRLLGLNPGEDIDPYGLAALAGLDVPAARAAARTLERAHLLQDDGAGRYGMHDLVRAYATEAAHRDLSPDDRHRALTRLLDFHVTAAHTAADVLYVRSTRLRERPMPPVPSGLPNLSDHASAAAWYTAQLPNLVRLGRFAARHGWPGHAVSLALALWNHLDSGSGHDAVAVHSEALAATHLLGERCDPADRASLRTCLGISLYRVGRLEEAAEQLRLARDDHTQLGFTPGVTVALAALGAVHHALGRFAQSMVYIEDGLEIATGTGNLHQEGAQHVNLGNVCLSLEQVDRAARHYEAAAAIFDRLGVIGAEVQLWNGLAMTRERLGHYDEALRAAEHAIIASHEQDRPMGSIQAMDTVGSTYRRMGRLSDAAEQLDMALAECRRLDTPPITAQLLNTLGETRCATGEHAAAIAAHTEALAIARHAGGWYERVRALVGLGDAHDGRGDAEPAVAHWRLALAEYQDRQHPGAQRVLARLTR